MTLDRNTSSPAPVIDAVPTEPFHIPRIDVNDYCCDASRAVAQQKLQENPPEWLHELNWLMERVQRGPEIESMSVTEAEECLVAMRRKKSEDDNLLKCACDAIHCLMPLGMDLEKFQDLMTSILGHFGMPVHFGVPTVYPSGEPWCPPIDGATPASQA